MKCCDERTYPCFETLTSLSEPTDMTQNCDQTKAMHVVSAIPYQVIVLARWKERTLSYTRSPIPAQLMIDINTHHNPGTSLCRSEKNLNNGSPLLLLREVCVACRGRGGDLVAAAALLELVEDADTPVAGVVNCVPLAPIVGSCTLPLSSHMPLVYGGHGGGVCVGE